MYVNRLNLFHFKSISFLDILFIKSSQYSKEVGQKGCRATEERTNYIS